MAGPTQPVPGSARVVIIGGGVMGCGIAYHLAHEGWTDIVLLEKGELTSGSTWHAAGQITHSTSSFALGKCVDYNIGLYNGGLEAETGQSTTWHGCGSFRLAYDRDEMDWLLYTRSVNIALGFNSEVVDPAFVRSHHPFYNLDGVLGALYTPDDGHVDPSGVTLGLARGARQLGAKIIRQCRATNVQQLPSGEWLVSTEHGDIRCEHVVNAGGTYARQVGDWSGINVPTTSMTHHYFVTETVPEFLQLERELPVIRDDKRVSGYIRMEQKSGLIGIYEKAKPNVVWDDHCPWEAENHLFEADYDRVMPWLENALDRMPIFAELGIKQDVHGAISHPPDGNPLIGPVAEARNYWCCCGTQIGIGWGPGLTRELARWMVHGSADISMRAFDPRRFGSYADKKWQNIKAREDYLLRHEIPFPHFNRLDGRPVKKSPLYDRLKSQGAVFEEIYGHERPRWFATGDEAQRDHYSFRRNIVDERVAEEHRAVRERVGIMDICAFTKVEVSGPDAELLLDRLIANRLPAKQGGICLTHMLNRRGRIEMEMTILNMGEGRYYLTCAAFFEQRLLDHLAHHTAGEAVTITNRSSDWFAMTLQGPRAPEVLAEQVTDSLALADFPWLRGREMEIAGQRVWALRLSYAGEMGWEFHGPRDAMLPLYDALWQSGQPHGIANYGSFAMNTLRMEKMFPGASELTNEVTLPEANVMRFVRSDKDFLGKADSLGQAELPWVCAYLAIEADGIDDGHGGEPVLLDGEVIGSTTSIAMGHSVGRILAFAYIKPAANSPGQQLEVVIANAPRAAVVLGAAAYDPNSERPRGIASAEAAA